MAEESQFWTTNGTGDGPSGGYNVATWNDLFNKLFAPALETAGAVLVNVGNQLAVTGASSPLSLDTGAAIVNGYLYENTTSKSLAVTTPTIGTTGGRVILRVEPTLQRVRAYILSSANGVSALPALTQTASSTWEIPLYNFTITTGGVITLTDVRSFAHFATRVSTAMLDANAVITDKIADGNVIATKIADGSVIAAKIANDAIDDTKVGNRVPQFYRRQGANASDWSLFGTTNHIPTTVRQQAGIIRWIGTSNNFGSVSVVFPVPFSNKPIVLVTIIDSGGGWYHTCNAQSITASGFDIYWSAEISLPESKFAWLAIGPE